MISGATHGTNISASGERRRGLRDQDDAAARPSAIEPVAAGASDRRPAERARRARRRRPRATTVGRATAARQAADAQVPRALGVRAQNPQFVRRRLPRAGAALRARTRRGRYATGGPRGNVLQSARAAHMSGRRRLPRLPAAWRPDAETPSPAAASERIRSTGVRPPCTRRHGPTCLEPHLGSVAASPC